MFKIKQENFPMRVCATERQFKYWLKIAQGRRDAFGRQFKTYRLVEGKSLSGQKWEEFDAEATQ